MKHQTLYKKTKTGAIQQYDISTDGAFVVRTQGQVNGAMQTYRTECFPKNVGKSNETTAEKQAEFEALSKWKEKCKQGYTINTSGEILVQLPQKVKAYIGNETKVSGRCFSTPKLNGVNGIYWLLPDGTLKLTSRGGDEYPSIPHLEEDVKYLMELLDTDCLNGELYIHGEHLQDITSAVKKPKELSKKLEFAVFALPTFKGTYENMRKHLFIASGYFAEHVGVSPEDTKISFLTGIECNSPKDIETHYNECMANGLEGTVIYLPEATYAFNERNSKVFKYKKTLDAEFLCTGYSTDKNGFPVLELKTGDSTFNVKPKGTAEERIALLSNLDDLIGNWYKIEYETLSKAGIPLKPVGIMFRNCDASGEPLE